MAIARVLRSRCCKFAGSLYRAFHPICRRFENGTVLRAVSANYFETIGTRIVRGRAFTAGDDREDGEPLAIVNASMATMLWPNGDAVGRCIQVAAGEAAQAPCRRVVGIAEDVHLDLTNTDPLESASVYVRLSTRAARLRDHVR